MTPPRRQWSLRLRLTLSASVALVVLLSAYAVGIFLFFREGFHAEFDTQLGANIALAEEWLEWSGRGDALRWRTSARGSDAPFWLEAWSSDGALLYRSGQASRAPIEPMIPARDLPKAITARGPGNVFRVFERRASVDGRPAVMRAAISENAAHAELSRVAWLLGIGLPLGALGAAAAGYLLAGRALAPVDRLAAQAGAITADRLGERLHPESSDDEFGRLARAFNVTLERLEQSFDQMRRFTSDASHELRTPLTAMRSVGEVGLQRPQTPERYREVIGSMLEEVDRLGQLVDSLLLLSRADARDTALSRRSIQFASLAAESVAQLSVLAEEKNQRIQTDLDPSTTVSVDRVLMRRAIDNLLDNAIKFSPPRSAIGLTLAKAHGVATLTVRDEGPGIPASDQPHIFERFYRVDRARSRETPGVGLGLAIAHWIVQAHGGELTVESVEGQGSTFRIALPV